MDKRRPNWGGGWVEFVSVCAGESINLGDYMGLLTKEQREELRQSANKSPVATGATGEQIQLPGDYVVYGRYTTKYGEVYRETFEKEVGEDGKEYLVRITDGDFFTKEEIFGSGSNDSTATEEQIPEKNEKLKASSSPTEKANENQEEKKTDPVQSESTAKKQRVDDKKRR